MLDILPMSPVECETALEICWRANQPAMFHGKPGGGKTSMIRAFTRRPSVVAHLAEMLKGTSFMVPPTLPLITVNLSMFEPVDMRGLPHDNGTATVWRRPAWLPTEERDGPVGLIFFDEVNTNRAMFPTLYQVFCADSDGQRACGEHLIPKGWLPIAAGNYRSDRAAAVEMPSAWNNRVAHFDYVPDWRYYAGELAARIGLHPMIAAYVRFRPDMLHLMPGEKPAETHIPQLPSDARAFPTPRSWEAVSDILKQSPGDDIRQRLIAAKVGPESAADFESFFVVARDAAPIDSIVADPDRAPIPQTVGLLHAVTSALAAYATRANFAAIIRYGKRLADKGHGEFYVTMGLDAVRRHPELKTSPGFADWQIDNAAVIC